MTSTERSRLWRKANPEKWAVTQRAYRQRNRKPCRECGGPMPYPSPGLAGCSSECRKAARKRSYKAYCERTQWEFNRYKTDRGCDHCGYRRYPAALDFHHVDPAQKERRVSARMWRTAKGKAEVEKCILLCSNCHHEEHERMKQNGDVP